MTCIIQTLYVIRHDLYQLVLNLYYKLCKMIKVSMLFWFLLQSKMMTWEQELYTQFKYKTPRDYFHTFEAHVSVLSGTILAYKGGESDMILSAVELRSR